VAHYATALQQLLAPACRQRHLQGKTLPALAACLTCWRGSWNWLTRFTGRLSLDSEEQHLLLNELANALGQPCTPLPAQRRQLHGRACWAGNRTLMLQAQQATTNRLRFAQQLSQTIVQLAKLHSCVRPIPGFTLVALAPLTRTAIMAPRDPADWPHARNNR
jgi:hypothetical protein